MLDAWIAELEEPEPPPEGLAPEITASSDAAPDLFSLLGQLTALTRETQLQGRATNRLHTELGATLEGLVERMSSPETIARRLGEARREARLELVGELLEVRDRFTRNLAEAQRRLGALRGLRARLGQRPVLESLVQGNAMALDRLDDLLRRLDVREIPCLGKPFDPAEMRAVDVAPASSSPAGTVVEVFRPGYVENDRVIRFAEVRVAGGTPPVRGERGDG